MQQEVELKLLIPETALATLEQLILPTLKAKVEKSESQLLNHYFDTPDRSLRKLDIGFRVRGRDGQYEQTVKTAGETIGGLHKRPEFNLPIEDEQPDICLFDCNIFPDELDLAQIQNELQILFTTHFLRTQYLLTFDSGEEVELALDQGFVRADKQKEPICELELELKAGQPNILFDLADEIAKQIPIKVGNLSKAARGYRLADGNAFVAEALSDAVPLPADCTLEQAFSQAMSNLLVHWQNWEIFYQQEPKPKALKHIYQAKQLILHLLTVTQSVFDSVSLVDFSEALQRELGQWKWLDSMLAFKALQSKRGSFRKGLAKQEALLSYLRGRQEGLLAQYQPLELVESRENHQLQLALARLLCNQEWRDHHKRDEYQQSAAAFAEPILASEWMSVQQSLLQAEQLTAEDYLTHKGLLQTSLHTGFLFGGVFNDNRADFRAPWLDIIEGIQELSTLKLLQHELPRADIQDADELKSWSQDKINSLVAVMEKSRAVAMHMRPYWQGES